jgi:hypothetical protein
MTHYVRGQGPTEDGPIRLDQWGHADGQMALVRVGHDPNVAVPRDRPLDARTLGANRHLHYRSPQLRAQVGVGAQAASDVVGQHALQPVSAVLESHRRTGRITQGGRRTHFRP